MRYLNKCYFLSFKLREVTLIIFINWQFASTYQIKINQMAIKFSRLLVLALLFVALVSAMPHEPRIPTDIDSSDILLTDASIGQEMVVVVTKTELRVYKQGNDDSYSLLLKKPVCEASALSVTQTGFLPSNDDAGSVYNVVVGCKDGYFHVYDISLEKNNLVKSFAKKLGQPVDQVLSAKPYLLISTSNHIYMFNLLKSEIEMDIPIVGSLTKTLFEEADKLISTADLSSEIQIKITLEKGIQILRKALRPNLTKGRLLQVDNSTVLVTGGICGDGTINAGQECDDGNLVNGDGCTDKCVAEKCGDGIVNNKGLEQCDDGNTVANDGCTDCKKDCGNGVVQGSQECDDGNTISGDGCSDTCMKEAKQEFKASLGAGLGVGGAAVVSVVAGTAAAPAGAAASSLIGSAPLNLAVGQVAQQIAGQAAQQAAGQVAAQAAQQAASQAAGQAAQGAASNAATMIKAV